MAMDNSRIVLVSEYLPTFLLGMQIAFRNQGEKTEAKYWWLYEPKPNDEIRRFQLLGLSVNTFFVLSWGKEPSEQYKMPLPSFLGWEQAAMTAWHWLQRQDFGPEPDQDGSNHKGFVLFTDSWGHVGSDHYGIVAVGPAWAMAGK